MRVADIFRRGIAAGVVIVLVSLSGLSTRAQSSPADGRQKQSPYFDRGSIELSVGYEAFKGLPARSRPKASFCPRASTSAILSPSLPKPGPPVGRAAA